MSKCMFLVAFIFLLLGSGTCEVTKIYASQDVYFGLQSERIYGNETILRCEVNATQLNNTSVVYPGEFVSMVQFNISGLNISQDDIGILVLKAESVKGDEKGGMVAAVPVASEWDESSEFLELALNLLPLWKSLKENELAGQIGTDSDGDRIFAYDISGRLKETKEDRISFFLEAVSNGSYRADFKSRESGEGPYIMVIPYPSVLRVNLTQNLNMTQSENLLSDQGLNQSSKQVPENALNNSTMGAAAPEPTLIQRDGMEPKNIQRLGGANALSAMSSPSAL
jgi:hypothetical protein